MIGGGVVHTFESIHILRTASSDAGEAPQDDRVIRHAPTIVRARAALLGLTDSDLRRLTATRELLRLRRGGYVGAEKFAGLDTAQKHATAVTAALQAQQHDTYVCHQSALVLLGIPFWSISLERVHLGKRRRNSGRLAGGLHIHSAMIEDDELVHIDGVPLTSPARTVFDVACSVPFEQAVVVADAALHAKVTTPSDLAVALERGRGRSGRARAALALDFADGLSESVGESRSRVGMYGAGVSPPELQYPVFRENGSVAAITDFRWGNLVGEFDGRVKYGRLRLPGETPGDAVVREKVREDEVRDLGRRMIRWMWRDLNTPAELWPRLARAIQRWS
jgi:hypothetical protein